MIDSASALSWDEPTAPGGGLDPGRVEVLGVGHRQVLTAVVVVRDQAGEVLALALPSPDALADGVDDELAGHRRRD